jgi:two-component system sensor histidine kinase VicK
VRFLVRDTGIGIPAALQPVLFERFTPARRPGLRGEPTNGLGLLLCKTIGEPTNGLGLLLCKTIVEWHQGTITVASTEGIGTTFTVEIPQAE